MKLEVGKTVKYQARKHSGKMQIQSIETKTTGEWVTGYDKARKVAVTVRPSQVSSAR